MTCPPYQPYHAPAYTPVPPWGPPQAEEVDLTTLPLDELLERYAWARQAHRDHLARIDDVEKLGAHLREQEQKVKDALLAALVKQQKDEALLNQLVNPTEEIRRRQEAW